MRIASSALLCSAQFSSVQFSFLYSVYIYLLSIRDNTVTAAGEGGAPFLSKRLHKTMTTSATAMTAVEEGPSSGLDRALYIQLFALFGFSCADTAARKYKVGLQFAV